MKLYYHPISGHAHRARLFLSLIGADIELVEVNLAKGEHKAPEYLKLDRFGQVPLHIAQPLQQFVQHRPVQEIMRRETGQHPVAPARAQRSVENVGAGVHGGPCACAAKREQGR